MMMMMMKTISRFFLEIFELLTRLGGSHIDLNHFQTIIRSYTAFSDIENVPSNKRPKYGIRFFFYAFQNVLLNRSVFYCLDSRRGMVLRVRITDSWARLLI